MWCAGCVTWMKSLTSIRCPLGNYSRTLICLALEVLGSFKGGGVMLSGFSSLQVSQSQGPSTGAGFVPHIFAVDIAERTYCPSITYALSRVDSAANNTLELVRRISLATDFNPDSFTTTQACFDKPLNTAPESLRA